MFAFERVDLLEGDFTILDGLVRLLAHNGFVFVDKACFELQRALFLGEDLNDVVARFVVTDGRMARLSSSRIKVWIFSGMMYLRLSKQFLALLFADEAA